MKSFRFSLTAQILLFIVQILICTALLCLEISLAFAQAQEPIDHALRFDGTDDYVEVPHIQAYENVTSESFTIGARFQVLSFTSGKSQVIIKKSHGPESQFGDTWRLEITGQGQVLFFLKDIHTGYSEYADTGFQVLGTDVSLWGDLGTVKVGQWYDVHVVYQDNMNQSDQGESIQIYVDHQLVRHMTPLRPNGIAPQGRAAQSTGPITIGQSFHGEIDQIVWYDQAISLVEIGDVSVPSSDRALVSLAFDTRSEIVLNDAANANHGRFYNADLTPPEIVANTLDGLTLTQLSAHVTAIDNLDGSVPVAVVAGQTGARLGSYDLTYKAVDTAGNVAFATLSVQVTNPVQSAYVTLQTSDGRNVFIDEGQGNILFATSENAGLGAKFYVENLGADHYAFRTHMGQYVAGEDNQNGYVIADRNGVGPWEMFTLIPLGDKQFALKTSGEKYVTVGDGNGSRLLATTTEITEQSIFQIDYALPLDGYFTLQSSKGMWVSADQTRKYQLIASRTEIGPWEVFYLKHLDNGKYALQAFTGLWVAKEQDAGGRLMGDRDMIGPWEEFEMVILGENTFALKDINGDYVSAKEEEDGRLFSNRELGPEEMFTIKPALP